MILEIILLLLAIPVGFLIAYLTPEELKEGQKYFKTIIITSVFVGGWFYLTGETYVAWSAGFMVIVSFISVLKNGK